MAVVQALAAGMPSNPTKPDEHGFVNGVAPKPGVSIAPPSRLPGASTLSEANASEKTGGVAPEGVIGVASTRESE